MRRALLLMLLCGCSGPVDPGGTGGGSAGGGMLGPTGGGATAGGTTTAGGAGTAGGTATAGGTGAAGGSADAGRDAGVCTAMFCDDFERYDAGRQPTSPWSVNTNGGTVTIDTTRTHSGGRSVHVTTDGNGAYRQAYFGVRAPFFPVAGNSFYGRAWFYVTAVPAMTTHWTNISGEGPVPDAGTNVRAFVRYGGQVMKRIMANYDTSGVATDCWKHSTVAMPAGSWNCYEWHFDQPNNRMELWLDGVQLNEVTVNGTGSGCIMNGLNGRWLLPQFDVLRLGWEHYQTSIAIDMWVDDVALDRQRIGCN